MAASALQARIDEFLAQPRIAVAGVSARPGAANAIWRRLKAQGHQVFAVNPTLTHFEGEPAWPDVKAIPGGVDGVVIVTRPEVTDQIVRDCIDAGVRRVWMHQSGAKAGPGTSVSPQAVRQAREHGLSVIAGACPMMFGPDVDFGHACMRWMLRLGGGLRDEAAA